MGRVECAVDPRTRICNLHKVHQDMCARSRHLIPPARAKGRLSRCTEKSCQAKQWSLRRRQGMKTTDQMTKKKFSIYTKRIGSNIGIFIIAQKENRIQPTKKKTSRREYAFKRHLYNDTVICRISTHCPPSLFYFFFWSSSIFVSNSVMYPLSRCDAVCRALKK